MHESKVTLITKLHVGEFQFKLVFASRQIRIVFDNPFQALSRLLMCIKPSFGRAKGLVVRVMILVLR